MITIAFLAVEVLPSYPGYPVIAIRCHVAGTWDLYDSAAARYVVFVANLFRGEWGPSLYAGCPSVGSLIIGHASDTLILAFGGLAVSALLARAIGPALARRHGKAADALGVAGALGSAALPAAGLGLLLALVLLAVAGFVPQGDHAPEYASLHPLLQAVDYVGHLALPLLAVVALSLGPLLLAVRGVSQYEQVRRGPRLILESLSGSPSAPGERRAGVPPVLPEVRAYVGWTLCAALLVELVFGLDGLGSLLLASTRGDVFLVSGVFLFLALFLIATSTAIGLLGIRAGEVWSPPEPPAPGGARPLSSVIQEIMHRPTVLAGVALLGFLVGITLAGPTFIGPYATPASPFAPPSAAHPWGTGRYGIDLLASVLTGGASVLVAAAWAFGFAIVAGTWVALASAVLGGRADAVTVLLIEGLLCLPWLPLLALLGATAASPGFLLVALLAWPMAGRALRRDVEEQLWDQGWSPSSFPVATAAGATAPRWFWSRGTARLLVSMSPLIVSSALAAASYAVLIVAGIVLLVPEAWLGLASGPPGVPSWETMIASAWQVGPLVSGAWSTTIPFILCLISASLAFAVLGFSLREAALPFPLSVRAHRHGPDADA